MRKLLITGFDPFGKQQVNPSWLAVEGLPEVIGDFEVHKLLLPTVYALAAQRVLEEADRLQPQVILCIGLAQGRNSVTPERIGVNIRDASLADNRGRLCSGEKIVPEGPAAYFATVQVEAMAQAIRDVQLPGRVSNSAGSFVCNDVLYTLLHHYAATETAVGFIHVPALADMPLEQIRAALLAAIGAC